MGESFQLVSSMLHKSCFVHFVHLTGKLGKTENVSEFECCLFVIADRLIDQLTEPDSKFKET